MTTTNLITLPVPYFPDPDTNEPLASASVYIGEPNTDPTVEGNRITVTLIEQDGTEVSIAAAQQPVLMASAMKKAIEAGREAFLAGRMPRKRFASASSPIDGTFF